MAFWGAVVKPGKPYAFVPPPEEWNLHLSQAALPPTVPEGQRVALAASSDPKDEPVIICTLTAGRTDTAVLDLFFSQYTEFSVIGEHALHLSGYYSPSQMVDDEDEGEEDEDEEEYTPGALGFPMHGDDDDEDDEGEDDEDEDDDDLDGLDEDEDEDGLMDEDGVDDEVFGYEAMLRAKRKPRVVIEDITEQGQEPAAKGEKKDGKNGVKVEEESEEAEEDEDEDEDEEDEDEEGEEEEEEEAPAAKGGKAAAAAGSKRPAEAKPTANGAAKKQAVGQDQQPQPMAKGKEAKPAQPKASDAKTDAKPEVKPKAEAKLQQQKQEQKQKDQQPQQQKQQQKQEAAKTDAKAGKKNIRRHPNGFEIEDVSYGNPHGKLAKPGHKVHVRYTGRLKSNGKVFDKSGGKPFQFRLGVGEVIKGWDLGVGGMRVGDKRRLVIPPQLAYGAAGVKGTIPSNATLEFDVELVDVK